MGNPATDSLSPNQLGMHSPPPMTMLSAQHERLILELLPFKDSAKFKEWIQSGWVQGSWAEFWRDCVTKTRTVPEPDKNKTAEAAKNAITSRAQKFLVYHPDKTTWTSDDHHVRFIVTLIQDNMLRNLWSDSDWKKKNIEICKAVYEVLCFLKSSSCAVDPHPPLYSQ